MRGNQFFLFVFFFALLLHALDFDRSLFALLKTQLTDNFNLQPFKLQLLLTRLNSGVRLFFDSSDGNFYVKNVHPRLRFIANKLIE